MVTSVTTVISFVMKFADTFNARKLPFPTPQTKPGV